MSIPTYLINLRRRPEKLIKVLWTNDGVFKDLDFDLRVIEAVDGRNPNLDRSKMAKLFQESPGAYGYVLTWEKIIENAIKLKHERIIIMDDDVICHQNIVNMYNNWFQTSKIRREAKIILLGASQHSFKNINLQNLKYYHPKKTDGSFAVILHNSIFVELLQLLKTHQKLVDSHCLRDLYKKYYDNCFVITPNLIIADVKQSDIRESRNQNEMANIFRWDLSQYIYPFTMPLVTIIVPSYKSGKTIQRCLESMINQTYRPLEIIVIDDGSPDDNYLKICQTFQKWQYDSRANPNNFFFSVYRHNTNKGCYSSRNLGLEKAKGDIIGFQDADDISLDNRIMEEVRVLLAERVDFVCCQFLRTHLTHLDSDPEILAKDIQKTRIHKTNEKYDYCCRAKIALATTMFRRSLVEKLGYYDESMKWGGDAEYLRDYLGLSKTNKGVRGSKLSVMSYLDESEKIGGKYYQVKEILYLSHEMNEQNLTIQRLKYEKEQDPNG